MADDAQMAKIDGLYTRLRKQVEHENSLYNQRIVWLITMQAFLFASIGFFLQAKVAAGAEKYGPQIDAFTALVCVVGLLVALISWRTLANSRGVLRRLGKVWDKQAASFPPELDAYYPHISGGDGKSTPAVFLRSGNLPLLFAISWIVGGTILLEQWIPHMQTVLNRLSSHFPG